MPKTINTRIKEELDRMNTIFEGVDEKQRANAAHLIQNAAFMKVTLEDLQEIIKAEGVTEVYQNGANQSGVKQSATLQSYNALIKNYTTVIKTLSALLPVARKISPFALQNQQEQIEEDEETEEEKNARRKAEVDMAIEYQRQQRENSYSGSFLQFQQEWIASHKDLEN